MCTVDHYINFYEIKTVLTNDDSYISYISWYSLAEFHGKAYGILGAFAVFLSAPIIKSPDFMLHKQNIRTSMETGNIH